MSSSNQTSENSTPPQGQLDEVLSFLQQLELFRGTPLAILKLYAYLSKIKYYKAGKPILMQGKPAHGIYLMMSGSVSIYEQHGGKNLKLQQLPHETINYFGELALLAEFEWFFSAWADSDTILLTISREAFQKVMERFPESFPQAIEKIIRLRINRYVDQTRGLVEKTDLSSWETCPYSVHK